ncbi:SET domain-containing protein [Pseudomonas sp. LB3P14]
MKAHPLHRTPAQPPDGIYPSPELSVSLGFPSRKDFEIIYNANESAVAVAALREFPRISRICRVSGHLLPYRNQHTRQLAPGIHVCDPHFSGLLEHSCCPNVFFDMSELWLWALKDIQKGDHLTMDFATTEDKLLRQFACCCGCPECREWICGYNEPPNADGQLYYHHCRRRSLC